MKRTRDKIVKSQCLKVRSFTWRYFVHFSSKRDTKLILKKLLLNFASIISYFQDNGTRFYEQNYYRLGEE